ncbi:MAG: transposase, partial [Cytophagales bacterium]
MKIPFQNSHFQNFDFFNWVRVILFCCYSFHLGFLAHCQLVFCRPDLPAHVTVRLLKKRNKNGEVQVFCTSLLDTKKYDRKSIINLYHQRWNIEEAYKFIKTRLDIEDWSGKTALSVKQDFFAKTLLLTLCNIMCFKIKPKLKGN